MTASRIILIPKVASAGGGATGLDDLTDVTITAAASGDILRHNGTAWVDTPGTTHFEAAGAVATHAAVTTNVHGIADTSVLETTTGSASKVSTHAALTSSVHGISAFGATLVDDADAATARSTLGLVIGTNVQAYDADLADLAGITRTKGDLIVGGSSAWLDLAVGTDGQVLTADSAQSTGVKWAAVSGGGGADVAIVNSTMGAAAPGMIRLAFGNAAITLTSGVTYYTGPFELDRATSLTGFTLKIDSITGTAHMRIALVSVDPVDLQPLALVYAVAEQTWTTTGEKTVSFSSQSIPAGVYYVAFRTDNSTVALTAMRMAPASGWRGNESGWVNKTYMTVSEAYGAFGATPTDWTTTVLVSTSSLTGMLVPLTWLVA